MMAQDYIFSIFENFVMPGMVGGFIVAFSVYLISQAVALAYRLIANN